MSDKTLIYYRRRAEAELELAQCATTPVVRDAHQALADAYLKLAGEPLRGKVAD